MNNGRLRFAHRALRVRLLVCSGEEQSERLERGQTAIYNGNVERWRLLCSKREGGSQGKSPFP